MGNIIRSVFLIVVICLSLKTYAYKPSDVNKFKDDTNCLQCNLTWADFSPIFSKEKSGGKFDGTFFTEITLTNYKISDSSFIITNFVKSNLRYDEFNNSIFQSVNLSYSSLYAVKFNKSNFKNINFSNVSMNGSFSSCSFNEVDFTNSDLDNVSFSKTNMVKTNFKNATLKNANFSKVHIENVSFNNADLSYAILIGSNITDADLAQAKTYKCATLANGDVFTNNNEYNVKIINALRINNEM